MHVLIIENDTRQAITLGEYLENQGHEPDFASDADLAIRLCGINRYDGIILDTRVTRAAPEDFCLKLRAQTHDDTPVLKLTLADQYCDHQAAGSSMVDTLPNTSSPDRIHECLKTLVDDRADGVAQLSAGTLHMDIDRGCVYCGDVCVDLSRISFHILELLMRAYPELVSRAEIEQQIWQDKPPESNAALRGHIHRLRQLLEGSSETMAIRTIHGVGYRLESVRVPEQAIATG